MTEETVISRIRRLTEAVRKARRGDFSFCKETSGKNDELDMLADEIRKMVESVQEHVVERKAAEDAQRDCEEKYRRLKANIPGMLYLFAMNPDGSYSFPYVNDASRQLFDISPEELMADESLIIRLIHPDDRERFAASVKRSAESLEPWREVVRHIVNGEVRWYDCMSRPEKQANGDILWDGIILEITERKQIEEALKQANLVVENSPVVLFRWRAAEGWPVELVSANIVQFGYTSEELLSGSVPFASMVHPDDLERVAAEVEEYSSSGVDNFQQEYRIVKKNGELCWVYDRTVIERDAGGKITHYQGIIIDISERKRMEQDLLLTKYCVDNAGIGIYHDSEQHIYNANDFACKSLGYTVEELRAMSVFDIDPVITMEELRKITKLLEINGSATHQSMHRRRDGTTFPVEITTNIVEFQGKRYGVSFVKDITERKLAEEALRQANMVVENSPAVLFRWRAAEGWPVELVSRNVTQFGYSPEEFLSGALPFASIVHPQDLERVVADVRGHSERGDHQFEQEYRIVTRDGAVRWVDDRTVIERDGGGQITHYQGIIFDITGRKQVEAALQESEGKFRVLAETSPTAIFLYQGEMIIYANPATERLFGYSSEELMRMRFWDWAHEDFREKVRTSGLARQRGETVPGRYESRFVTKAGEDRWLVVSAGLIEYQGRPAGIASFLDITESKRVEAQLRDSLAEKELLLKEVHHRVKNNLQVISTLLDLQADKIHDGNLQESIRESQDRIKAMALIHERLYQSSDLARIDFWEYIESLVGHLLSSYIDDPLRIVMKVDVGDIQLAIDRAIPCGLIINELVSNAMKHAFPDGRSGKIAIRLHANDRGQITLTVADDGVGMPPGVDFRKTESLGLQLVNMLTRQLRGQIEMSGDHGTLWVISFRTR
jgi:PAS domain S-box-containing protein